LKSPIQGERALDSKRRELPAICRTKTDLKAKIFIAGETTAKHNWSSSWPGRTSPGRFCLEFGRSLDDRQNRGGTAFEMPHPAIRVNTQFAYFPDGQTRPPLGAQ